MADNFNMLRVVVHRMHGDIGAAVADHDKKWGVSVWAEIPPVLTLKCGGVTVSTSASAKLEWNERFLFLLPANGLGACQLELTVEQPRHLLRGGPICVAKAWWSGTLARGRKSASEGFAVRLPLELNPQYAGSNAGTSGGPGAPGGVAAASTQDLESGGVGGCCVEVQLQGLFRGDAADLVAQCVQGQSDSDDESDDDVAASDEEEEEEEEDHEAAAEAAEEAMVAAAAAVARAGDDERGASAKSVLPSVDKAGSASEAATRLTKAARLKSLRAAKAHKAAAREAARKKTPDEVAAAKAEAEAETMLASITVHPGTYQVVVHVIQAKSLASAAGLSAFLGSGVPDPMIAVSVNGVRQRTRVLPSVENAIFDDSFVFEVPNVSAQTLGNLNVDIEAIDTHTVLPGGHSIGKYVVGLEAVYFANGSHELYRKWVALEEYEEGKAEPKVRGFLQCSVTVLGPGEVAPFHDRPKEKAAEAAGHVDPASAACLTSGGRPTFQVLRLRCHRAEGLPPMDYDNFARRWTGLDALVQLKYGDVPLHTTRTKPKFVGFTPPPTALAKEEGRGVQLLRAEFNTEIRLPLQLPAVTQSLAVLVADADPALLAFGATGKGTPMQTVGRCQDLDLTAVRADSLAHPDDFAAPPQFKDSAHLSGLSEGFTKGLASLLSPLFKEGGGGGREGGSGDDEERADSDSSSEEEEEAERPSSEPQTRFGKPFWRHLYGGPLPNLDPSKPALDAGDDPALVAALNNADSSLGCAYRGSLLLSARVEPPPTSLLGRVAPPAVKKVKIKPLLPPPFGLTAASAEPARDLKPTAKHRPPSAPAACKHIVRVAVYAVTGLPDQDGLGRGTRYSLVASCGHQAQSLGSVVVARHAAASRVAAQQGGVANWPLPPRAAGAYELCGVEWPTAALPDVFLHLYAHATRGSPDAADAAGNCKADNGKRVREKLSGGRLVAYLRVRAQDVWGVGGGDVSMAQPRWLTLRPSPVLVGGVGASLKGLVGAGGGLSAGRLLVRLGVDRAAAADAAGDWPTLDAAATAPFALFVHVLQARALPAADENGRLDPYLKVSLAGEEQTTPTHEATTNPQFATSVAFPKLKLPTHPELSAPLNLSIYDYDKWSANDLVGTIDYPLGLARQAVDAFAAVEAAVARAALNVLLRASRGVGAGESKSGGSSPSEVEGSGGEAPLSGSTAVSLDGSVGVTAALTVHSEGLWVWLSAVTTDEPAASANAAASGLTLAATSGALLAARLELAGAVAGAVMAAVQNVPLKRSLLRPVHFEIMQTDLPCRETHATPPNSELGYGGFAGDGVGDDGGGNTALAAAAQSQSVDFEHLLRRRRERLVAAKAHWLALQARALSSVAAGKEAGVAAEAERRMDGVPADLKTLVALLQSSDTQVDVSSSRATVAARVGAKLNTLVLTPAGRPSLTVSTRDTAFSGAATPHWLPFMPADASAGGGGASGFDGSGTSAAADGDIGAGELLFAVELVALAPQTSPRHRSIDSSSSEGEVSAAALAAVVACPAPPASLTAVPSTRRWLDIMVVGCRDLKSSDGLPLLGPLVRFTCGGQPLVNLLDPATMRYIQKAAAAAASGPAASAGGGSEEPEETGQASDHGSVLYSGDYGRHGPKPKKWVDTSPGGRGGANPNFLERLVVPLLLPRDPAMAPSLEIAVLDKRLLALESLVGTAAIDLGRCTQEGREGPGSVNLDYRRPGTPSVEEAEGGNPFMAAGSTPAMRAAFRRRSRRLKMTVLKQKKKHEADAALAAAQSQAFDDPDFAVKAAAQKEADRHARKALAKAVKKKEAGIGAGGLVGLAAAQAEAARKAVERAMLGPEPPWLKHRPVLKKEFEVCAANGGGAVTDSGSDAEGDSDEAGEPVRAYDVLRLMRGSDFDGGGARQVGLLKMVVRVLSSPPLDALGYGPDDAAGSSQLSAWTPSRAAHLDDTASEASRASEDGHGDVGHGALAVRGNGAARRAVADEHVTAWWHDLTSAALAATHGGGGGGAAAQREDERLAMRRARLNPPRYVARVYCLEGRGLVGKDLDGKSDPYVRVKVGDGAEVSARDAYCESTLNPDLFVRLADVPIQIPGPATLEISVWDYDSFTGDDHIGSTMIDLEDRWFSQAWQSHPREKRPLEWRELWSPASMFPQGRLSVLVELLPAAEASLVPPWPVERPVRQPWEVRVVVWRTRNVPASDLGGFTDMYLRCFFTGQERGALQTDKHIRCETGSGSFNYRMKFPVNLPLPSSDEAGRRFVVQVWDWDLTASDDCLGVGSVDLTRHLALALARNEKALKRAAAANAPPPRGLATVVSAAQGQRGPGKAAPQNARNLTALKQRARSAVQEVAKKAENDVKQMAKKLRKKRAVAGQEPYAVFVEDALLEAADKRLQAVAAAETRRAALAAANPFGGWPAGSDDSSSRLSPASAVELVPAKKVAAKRSKGAPVALEMTSRGESGDAAGDRRPAGKTATKNKKRKKKKQTLGEQLRAAMGEEEDPPNARWVTLERHKGSSKAHPAGQVLISIELLPKALADSPSFAAGSGRGAPNANPELPAPTGRFDPTKAFSPYYMLQNTFGTNLIMEFGAVVACAVLVVVVVAVGPLVLALLELASNTSHGWGYFAFCGFILLFVLSCCGVRYKCVKSADYDPCATCCYMCPCDFAKPTPESDDEDGDEEAPLLAGNAGNAQGGGDGGDDGSDNGSGDGSDDGSDNGSDNGSGDGSDGGNAQ